MPVLLDGFVCTAAVAPLQGCTRPASPIRWPPMSRPRPAIAGCCKALELEPLLDLGMRLGEGSGACLAVNIVRSALACHTGMASFAEAGVSEK